MFYDKILVNWGGKREMAKILLVEDDCEYREQINQLLVDNGHEVIATSDNPVEVLMQYKDFAETELVISDYMMPMMNGVDFITYLKRVMPYIKVILLTGLEEEEIELQALDANANFFLNKNTSAEVLLKYIEKAMEIPLTPSEQQSITRLHSHAANLEVDLQGRIVYKNDTPIRMTRTEYNVLTYFLQNIGKVLTREDLLKKIWGATNEDVSERVIDTHIKILRKKLNIHCIQAIRGIGYKWDE